MENRQNKVLIALIVILTLGLTAETIYLLRAKTKLSLTETLKFKDLHEKKLESRPKTSGWQQTAPQPAFNFEPDLDSWNPFEEMERIQARMNQMFRDSFSRSMTAGPNFDLLEKGAFFEPDVDMSETAKEYIIKLDLPGMEKDKINVEVHDHLLTISGERKFENKESKAGAFYRMERSFGSFQRTIPLPHDTDVEGVDAEYKSGVITIVIPRLAASMPPQKQAKKVEVQ